MNPLFESAKYRDAELKKYTSISSLSTATGIPKPVLRTAKKANLAGFETRGSVDWTLLKPVLEDQYEDLVGSQHMEGVNLKDELSKRDIKLKDLQIKKLEKNLLEPNEVKQLLVELAVRQSVNLKTVFSELPPKLAGKSEPEIKTILDKALQEIFSVLKTSNEEVDNLSKNHD